MSLSRLHWLSPRRRWFQYRLRTLFALMTLLCVWLSYNAWRYHEEQKIVAGILARDPEAEVVWVGPSWLKWLDGQSVPRIFCRVQKVVIKAKFDIPTDVPALRLKELSALEQLTLGYVYDGYEWNPAEINRQRYAMRKLAPGVEMDYTTTEDRWYRLYRGYLDSPTDAAAARLREAIKTTFWRSDFPDLDSETPRDIDPCPIPRMSEVEASLARLLTCRHDDLRITAARELWAKHSRQHAKKAVALSTNLASSSAAARQLKSLIDADLTPERILVELRKPPSNDTVWWLWLAALRPHPTFVPRLLQLAETKSKSIEVIYALGQSKDSRALPVLSRMVVDEDRWTRDFVAKMLRDMPGPATESHLVEALSKYDLHMASICDVLAEIGTERSLPVLRRIAADPQLGGTNAEESAKAAIKAIEKRSKP